jgi:hypothetical protein
MGMVGPMKRPRLWFATLVIIVTSGLTPIGTRPVPALLLFGRQDHKTFLGCLNCNKFSDESVCNKFADTGSRFSDTSIWNRFNDFGSHFSDFSPWNKFASYPPIIVDSDGNSYGYFTASRYHGDRTKIAAFLRFLDNVDWVNEDLNRARDSFCGD